MIKHINLTNIENILLPVISLLVACIYQIYSIIFIYANSTVENKVEITSLNVIIFTTFINIILLIINFYKVINFFMIYGLNLFGVVNAILLTIAGIIITILPGIYINNIPNRNIFCSCSNGMANVKFFPSKNECCKKCNQGYHLIDIDENKICVVDK
uniref:Uncharacterized protein n=1 Tax=viral metagenome TaxID=1070528 RepID=A0A6C0CWH3_9ZZZZ